MSKKPTALSYKTILLVLVISTAIPTLHSTGSTAATPIEFSLPITEAKTEDWNTLIGVGTMLSRATLFKQPKARINEQMSTKKRGPFGPLENR